MSINEKQLAFATEFESEILATTKFDKEDFDLIHDILLKVLEKNPI